MRTTSRFITRLVLFAATTNLAILLMSYDASVGIVNAQGQNQNERSQLGGKTIEGTWKVCVTLRNCQTGGELRNFPALLTFVKGGTFTGATTAFPPSQRGPDRNKTYSRAMRPFNSLIPPET